MTRPVGLALLAALVLVGAYLVLGGASAGVPDPPDPCRQGARTTGPGLGAGLERVALTAVGAAACDLGISRERLLLGIAGVRELPAGLDQERREQAIRAGLRRAVDEEERAGRLGAGEAQFLRTSIEFLPVDALLDRLLAR